MYLSYPLSYPLLLTTTLTFTVVPPLSLWYFPDCPDVTTLFAGILNFLLADCFSLGGQRAFLKIEVACLLILSTKTEPEDPPPKFSLLLQLCVTS